MKALIHLWTRFWTHCAQAIDDYQANYVPSVWSEHYDDESACDITYDIREKKPRV